MSNYSDKSIAILLGIFFIIFTANFSPQSLGQVYFAMVVLYLIAKVDVGIPDLSVSMKSKGLLKTLGIAVLFVIGWLFISQLGMSIYGTPTNNIGAVVNLLAANTEPPYITTIPTLFWFVFGLLIPIAETLFFFGVAMPWIMKSMNFTYDNKLKWIAVMLAIGIVCSLAHYTAHIFSDEALIADFIFFSMSGFIVLYKRDLFLAMLTHIISNSVIIFGMLHLFGL